MHGIVLKRLGHNVHILNRNPTSLLHDQGAGITALDNVQEFFHSHDSSKQPYSITSPNIQFLNRDAEVIKTWDIVLQTTSWNVLYYRLRANFDGLQSEYCPESLKGAAQGEGKAVYDPGKTVTDVKNIDELLTVEFDDVNGGGGRLHTDLVIAADGPGSKIRQMLQPDLRRNYAGYVAWRGTVLEQEISEESRKVFGDKITYFQMNPGHILL